jgi:hypothetical protein
VLAAEVDGVNPEEIQDLPKASDVIMNTDAGAESREKVF